MPVIWLLENFYWLQVIKLVQTINTKQKKLYSFQQNIA